jgi:predicted aldo/keto reductase-like oxidoreductase
VGRLPASVKESDGAGEAESIRMLRHAIDHGVNYIDIDCPIDEVRRENLLRLVGRALQCEYRERVRVATTLSCRVIGRPADFDRKLDELTRWLRTDTIDFFIFRGLDRQTWPVLQASGRLEQVEKTMAEGRIGKLGFGFCDDFQTLRSIVDCGMDWAVARFRYSFMDHDLRPGVSGLRLAASRGLGVVAAEPLKGGRLVRNLPGPVAGLWAGASPERSTAEWALRWAWDHPEISTVVSDMSALEQVKDNIALADSVEPDSLSVDEQVLVSHVRDAYRKLRPVPCTGCRSCMPCPRGIDAPRIFELYNDAVMYGETEIPRFLFKVEGHCLDDCDACCACARACGRQINIPERLKEAERVLSDT